MTLRAFTGLRARLLATSLAILAIPWAGFHFLQGVEAFLRRGEEKAALALSRAVSTVLRERPEVFFASASPVTEPTASGRFWLRSPIALDGRPGDWEPAIGQAPLYAAAAVLQSRTPYRPESLTFRHMTGVRDGSLYAIFLVDDDEAILRSQEQPGVNRNDYLIIDFLGADGRFRQYMVTARRPGPVEAQELLPYRERPVPMRREGRIEGWWRETGVGYNLEVKIPLSLINPRLQVNFSVADVDRPDRGVVEAVLGATSGPSAPVSPLREIEVGSDLTPSPSGVLEGVLSGFEGRRERIWVLDREGRVLGTTGRLQSLPGSAEGGAGDEKGGWLRPFYRMILKEPARHFRDDFTGAKRLEGAAIQAALAGTPAAAWRSASDGGEGGVGLVLTAASPVRGGEEGAGALGAVVVEKTGAEILSLRNRAMEELLDITVGVFLVALLALFWTATSLSLRIRRLRDQAEAAIDADGRVVGEIPPSKAADELGDLSRSFSRTVEELARYNRYLETLGGKLSHELRTPLAVVASSLENLETSDPPLPPDEARVYLTRAREGVGRLSGILTGLGEAARLEQSLERAEWEDFDLAEVVAGCVAGYRAIHPGTPFDFEPSGERFPMRGAPEVIAQMLDKLAANAVDFAEAGTPVTITLSRAEGGPTRAALSVVNQGPPLPEGPPGRLFESMVSHRVRKNKGAPHLGMGLYLVRLAAEHHGGDVRAWARPDLPGVELRVTLPLTEDHPT